MANQFGIEDEKLHDIVDFVFQAILEHDNLDDLQEALGLDGVAKRLHVVKKTNRIVNLEDFQITILRIASRVQLMMDSIDMMTKCHVQSPEVAQEICLQFKYALDGGEWGLSLDVMLNLYRDQLEQYRTVRGMENEGDFDEEPRYDPVPRERYDPIRHE